VRVLAPPRRGAIARRPAPPRAWLSRFLPTRGGPATRWPE
jgi:hypothetical protein